MARLLLVLALTLSVAIPALAATPDAGSVGPEAPKAEWTGSVIDPLGLAYTQAQIAESAEDACATPAPVCDTYTLTVAPGGKKLTIVAAGAAADDDVGLSVTDPGGTEHFVATDIQSESVVIDNPAEGEYTVHVLSFPEDTAMDYAGTATLELPAAEPTAAPTTAPTASPDPTPAPTTEPAPTTPPASSPPPPAQAGPRSLAMQPDRRRLRTAVRFGFRTRVVCRGGCTKVKLRVYVSRLTARNLRLGNFAGDVEVGSARILRNAEGRRQVVVIFRPTYRKRLARAKSLSLALEAVATDPDGRVRTLLKRLTLRR
jgi:hypothetical protein